MKAGRILDAALRVSRGTAFSRMLGFVREVLMAYAFGTSLAKSAFDVAFRVPNLFRRLFGEGALSAAFIPVFTRVREEQGPAAANRLAGRAMTLLGVFLLALTALGMLVISAVLAGEGLGPRPAAVLPLLRIMLPYMFFICLVALCMAILNSVQHFVIPAYTPVLLNVVWIGVLIGVCPRVGESPALRVEAVAWGILAAGALQLLFQVPALLAEGIRLPPSLMWKDPAVRRVLCLMGPATLGMGIHQVNVCVDGVLALWVAEWAPAALTFAERLVYLPLGVFATALGTVLLPTFSKQALAGREDAVLETLRASMQGLMLIMIPAAVGLIVLARPVIDLAYAWQGGAFDGQSALLTARALRFYAPGLVVFSFYKLVVPAFYALEDTRTPLRIGLRMVGVNLALNVVFILTLPVTYKHAGLALATVIASAGNGLWLACLLQRRLGSPGWRTLGVSALRTSLAAGVMAAAVAGVLHLVDAAPFMHQAGLKLQHAARAGAGLATGLIVYGAVAAVLCRREAAALHALRQH